jgi:hypothetical protein
MSVMYELTPSGKVIRRPRAGAALIGTLAAASPARSFEAAAYQFRRRGTVIASPPGEYSIGYLSGNSVEQGSLSGCATRCGGVRPA